MPVLATAPTAPWGGKNLNCRRRQEAGHRAPGRPKRPGDSQTRDSMSHLAALQALGRGNCAEERKKCSVFLLGSRLFISIQN